MSLHSDISLSESLKSEFRKKFYEQNKHIALAMIVVVFVAPFVGLIVDGLEGAVWGVVWSVMAYYLAPYVMLKLLQ